MKRKFRLYLKFNQNPKCYLKPTVDRIMKRFNPHHNMCMFEFD